MTNDAPRTRPALPGLRADDRGVPALPGLEYGVYETEDGRLVIYDERHPDAYLRSDVAVDAVR